MIENYEERISALEKVAEGALAEIRDLKAEIAESNKANTTKPLQFYEGEMAWYVDSWGQTVHTTYYHVLHKISDANRRLFKSPEMAEEFRQKSQFIADALYWKQLFDADYVADWESDEEKWVVYYDHGSHKYVTDYTFHSSIISRMLSSSSRNSSCSFSAIVKHLPVQFKQYISTIFCIADFHRYC